MKPAAFTALAALVALAGLASPVLAPQAFPLAERGIVAGLAPLPGRLSETGLFERGSIRVRADHIAFDPQYPLWTDGLRKRRWLVLPAGAAIDASNPDAWVFPIGTRLFKEFGTAGRPVETRMSERLSDGSWRFASFVWNDAGTDATLAPEDGAIVAAPGLPRETHTVPARADCLACHDAGTGPVLGMSALQLAPAGRADATRARHAGEVQAGNAQTDSTQADSTQADSTQADSTQADSTQASIAQSTSAQSTSAGADGALAINTPADSTRFDNVAAAAPPGADLRTLAARGVLRGLPQRLLDTPPRIAGATPSARAALGYLHGNCGHCHNDSGSLASLDLSLAQQASAPEQSAQRTLASLLGHASRFRARGSAATARVVPGAQNASVLALRMQSTNPFTRMPPLGVQVVDIDGVALVERWIQHDLERLAR